MNTAGLLEHAETFIFSKPDANFKQVDMEKAIKAVREGMSQRTAAIRFKLPRISLLRRVGGKYIKPVGHPTALGQAEEANIAKTLGVVAKWGFALTRMDMKDVVKKYLKESKSVS